MPPVSTTVPNNILLVSIEKKLLVEKRSGLQRNRTTRLEQKSVVWIDRFSYNIFGPIQVVVDSSSCTFGTANVSQLVPKHRRIIWCETGSELFHASRLSVVGGFERRVRNRKANTNTYKEVKIPATVFVRATDGIVARRSIIGRDVA